ncbi:MAG: quinohemoprotein amine dehydrogenase subunit beta [Gammaproteobacteria bacterium]
MNQQRILATLAAGALLCAALPSIAKDYILTGVKPNKLALVDPAARKVERLFEVPNAEPGPLTIVPSPDGKMAYVIVNRWESVAGINLDSGEQTFRADFSSGDLRIKAPFAMDISPNGKELYVFQSPVKLGLGEYEVQDTYIAVYDTSTGLGAKPTRTFPAPRRTMLLAASVDGSKLYAASWDITVLDPKTGAMLGAHKLRNWDRPGFASPDVLGVWPQWSQTFVYSNPYFAVRTDKDPSDPEAYKTGLYTLDLATDDFKIIDFENTSVVIFSSVINPVNRNEAFAVYTTLSKIDLAKGEVAKRVDLDHTYYAINISKDGKEVYVGGTMSDIGVYSTDQLEKLGVIKFPDGNDMALASLQIIQR